MCLVELKSQKGRKIVSVSPNGIIGWTRHEEKKNEPASPWPFPAMTFGKGFSGTVEDDSCDTVAVDAFLATAEAPARMRF
jgi:hypothetical protein